MNLKNELRARIMESGYTMGETLTVLAEKYGWSASTSNLCNKLRRNSLRYSEVEELADVLGYDLVWKKRGV